MNTRHSFCIAWLSALSLTSLLCASAIGQQPTSGPTARVLIVVGPSTHPPGTHEVAAGGRLLAYCLEHAENVPGLQVDVAYEWPQDQAIKDQTQCVVFTGDTFPPERMPESESILRDLGGMMDRGAGIVCFHYATGLRDEDVAADGDHPLLHWMGGYFATRTHHHQSVAKLMTATIEPGADEHPVRQGWKPFKLDDEPYFNNYFGPNGPAAGVTVLATSMLPPEAPQRETVAWGIQRADGGRGVGIVMPHYYRNWSNNDLRMLILNSVVWSAGLEVPAEGVRSTPPDLTAFEPGSIEPQPRPAKKK